MVEEVVVAVVEDDAVLRRSEDRVGGEVERPLRDVDALLDQLRKLRIVGLVTIEAATEIHHIAVVVGLLVRALVVVPAVAVEVIAAEADYNGSWECGNNSKAYDGVEYLTHEDLKASTLAYTPAGQNDIDDENPQFVDWERTPANWPAGSGGGGTLEGAIELLKPGTDNSTKDMLDWIRDGFQPTNEAYRDAGDPADGSPDIGAVDLAD